MRDASLAFASHRHNGLVSTDQTERVGVEAVRYIFAELGWYVREPARPDYGVDLFVETAHEPGGAPAGRLLAVQVKSGTSYVGDGDGDIVVRPAERNVEYWFGHSLPVVLVVYDPDKRCAYWQAVTPEAAESTGKGWKVVVPREQTLDGEAQRPLAELANLPRPGPSAELAELANRVRREPPPEADELDRLRADLTWMEVLDAGGSVYLEAREWMHKSSGRGDLLLIAEPTDGGERIERQFVVFVGLQPYEDALPELFPWADFHTDEETLEQADEELWTDETGIWDSEDRRYIGHTEDFDEWRAARFPEKEGLRPYGEEAGEVLLWRLALRLNDLGRGVLALERYRQSR